MRSSKWILFLGLLSSPLYSMDSSFLQAKKAITDEFNDNDFVTTSSSTEEHIEILKAFTGSPVLFCQGKEGRIRNTEFTVDCRLGRGSHAEVYLVSFTINDKTFKIAVKQQVKAGDYLSEVACLKAMAQNPSSLAFYGAAYTYGDNFFFVRMFMEPLDGHWVDARGRFLTPEEKVKLAVSGLECLEYMHSIGWTHLDIKMTNLLYKRAGLKTKLCDFGFAELFTKGRGYCPSLFNCGLYFAPENKEKGYILSFGDVPYHPGSIDILSMGLCIFSLFMENSYSDPIKFFKENDILIEFNEERYKIDGDALAILVRRNFNTHYPFWDTHIIDPFYSLLHNDPSRRAQASEILPIIRSRVGI